MRFWVRDKKGSLSLSMEAIVILILAVVMLGLALAFVRGLFTKIGGNVDKTLDLSDLQKPPSADEPVVISPSSPEVKVGQSTDIAAGFYNPSIIKEDWVMEVLGATNAKCLSADSLCDPSTPLNILYSNNPFKLTKDKAVAKPINIKIGKNNNALTATDEYKTFILSVKFCSVAPAAAAGAGCETGGESFTKDFTVTVRK